MSCVQRWVGVKARRRMVIVGLGQTGLSMARFLHARGESFVVVDTREKPPALARLREIDDAIPVVVGPYDAALFARADRVLVSPGVSLEEPAIQAAHSAGAEVVGDIELFARHAAARVVAITGSNGKSSVTALVGEMVAAVGLRALVGGNYGTPALDLLREPAPDFYVLELSSFQLETVETLSPLVAAVLNVSPDHMDRYADLESYAATKGRVYRHASVAVYNRDDLLARGPAPGAQVLDFGLGEPGAGGHYGLVLRDGQWWLARGGVPYLKETELRTPGRHNTANALAALALGEAIGLEPAAMVDALRRFPGLPHRCQWVAAVDGVDWYNDSKGTNVGATLAAIRGLPGPMVLIAGGVGKGADFGPLKEAVAQAGRAVVLYGQDAQWIEDALDGVVPVLRTPDLRAAVEAARRVAKRGERVLFSPACASFDMFRGFEHRGETFVELVRERVR